MNDNATKKQIIDTMCTLVAQRGYDKTSIGQIADAIGIKKASIYYYFKSKEEIFLKLVSELYEDDYLQNPLLLQANIDVQTFEKEFLVFGDALIDSYFDNPDLRKVYAEIDLQTTRISALKEMVDAASERLNEFLGDCITNGIAIGAFPQDFNVSVNAQLLYMVLVGIDSAILYDLPIEPKAVWHEAISKLFTRKDSQ
ncbi:TetR/AcrR family transcriptional regulator [Eubacterium barkeri]|uniref:DNA-binding transcriptional regulator, AcrR family n=1 Tax=Eubacterium barkeri TaxID=1528 RepID=A0A1H3AE53_EUBBA|nr:TetR/AcrR family transcriptional regulator [Eubacterium barkeri]SDX27751.1 DNA-binding transcriptional regulator, AcrR family [Eubacterium barkeri]